MTKAEQYADALVAMVARGTTPAHAVKSLVAHLELRGHKRLLKRLGPLLARRVLIEERSGVMVEVAHESDAAHAKKEAVLFSGDMHIAVREEPSIIGGWRMVSKNMLVDNTHKRHLLDIYKRINISL